jgi:exopolysaccharide production protein ExoQ
VSMPSRSVFADHLDVRDVYARSYAWLQDAMVCLILLIQSTAVVTLFSKLSVPGLGAVWLMGGALCLLFVFMNPMATLKGALAGWPFIILAAWAFMSFGWTVNRYETFRGGLLLMSSIAFAFAFAASYSWKRTITLTATCLCGLLVFSVVLAIVMPSIGQMQGEHQGAWAGAWAEKQAMGIYGCLGVLAAMAMAWMGPKYWPWWFVALICAIGVVGSTSKTALVMMFGAVLAAFWLRIFYRGFMGKVTGGWLAAFGAILAIPIATGSFDFALKALGRTSDLTGRTDVWEVVRNVANMRPNEGWGFQAVFRGKDDMTSPYQWITEATDFLPANAHSSWLDIYIQLGQPGFALLVVCMAWTWLGLIIGRKVDNYAFSFAGATIAALTFISFTETNLVAPMELQWFMVVLLGTKLFLPMGQQDDPTQTSADSSQDGVLDGDTFTYDA